MGKILLEFKNFEIGIKELKEQIGEDLYNVVNVKPIKVSAQDVVDSIKKYTNGEITTEVITGWVNVVWFTDLYFYDPAQEDSISSVMSLLETLDEENVSFSAEEFDKMIYSLENNTECEVA